jgi:hypothetical protein
MCSSIQVHKLVAAELFVFQAVACSVIAVAFLRAYRKYAKGTYPKQVPKLVQTALKASVTVNDNEIEEDTNRA